MANHLPLPPGRPLSSRRVRGNPLPPRPVQRASHAALLQRSLTEIEESITDSGIADDEELDTRIVLKISGATRLDTGPFRGLNLINLGEGSGWTYAVLSDREARAALGSLLSEYAGTQQGAVEQDWDHPQSWAILLDDIDGIELYGPEDRKDPEIDNLEFTGVEVIDVLLWPSNSDRVAKERVQEILSLIEQAERRNPALEILSVDSRPQTTVVRVAADRELTQNLLDEAWAERVRPPLRPHITDSRVSQAAIPISLQPASGESIGVVDGLAVTANPLLGSTVVASQSFPDRWIFSDPDSHGTEVCSIASRGSLDFIVTGEEPPPAHPIVSARVFDTESDTLVIAGQAHETIPQAITWMVREHGVRVVNLSINRNYAIDTLLRSELTAALDEVSRNLNVVLVISSGNMIQRPSEGWLEGYPRYLSHADAGVADPGDAALAITVGSIAHRDIPGGRFAEHLVSIAPAGGASPFTRTGPVHGPNRAGVLKPEFVHNGGNWAQYDNDSPPVVDDPNIGVLTAMPPRSGRLLCTKTGTSYAAPAVAREVARIATRYPGASANLLRALTALSARLPNTSSPGGIDPLVISAYGQPEADRVLESSGPCAILTIDALMQTNSVVIHPLPIPYDFARGRSRRSLRVALAFDPPVRRSRREYIAGQMTIQLVCGLSFVEVERTYQRQPSRAEAQANPTLQRIDLPAGRFRPTLHPGSSRLEWNTLIRRDFIHGAWDPDDENYFLVVTHNLSPWTLAQRRSYSDQRYALAVQVVDEERLDLDVHGQISALLRAEARATARGRIRG